MVGQRTSIHQYNLERRKIELEEQLLDLQERRLDIEQKRIEIELRKLEFEINTGGGGARKEQRSSAENSADESQETVNLRSSVHSGGNIAGEEEYMQVIKSYIDDSAGDSADESDGADVSADEEPIRVPRERKDTPSRSRSSSQGDIEKSLPRYNLTSSTPRSSSRSKHRRSSRQRAKCDKNETDPDSPLPPLSSTSKSSRKLSIPPIAPRKGRSPMGRELSRKKHIPLSRGSFSSVDSELVDDNGNESDRSAGHLEHNSLPPKGDLSDGEKTTKRSNGSSHGVSPNQVAIVDVDVRW